MHFGITRNKLYLYGLPNFKVETDHKPLQTLYKITRKQCPPRIERHKLDLQGYKFELVWRPGNQGSSENPGPLLNDYASRYPAATDNKGHQVSELTENYINFVIKDNIPQALSKEEIAEETAKDSSLQILIKAISQGFIRREDQ